MKQRGSGLTDEEIANSVFEAIVSTNGTNRQRLQLDTRIMEDAGIAGDDGDSLFEYLDERFEMDWSGLDLGIHFGNEGLGLPLPWHIDGNCIAFEPRPITIRDLVCAIRAELWPGTPRVPISQGRRRWLHVCSWAQLGFLTIPTLLFLFALALASWSF